MKQKQVERKGLQTRAVFFTLVSLALDTFYLKRTHKDTFPSPTHSYVHIKQAAHMQMSPKSRTHTLDIYPKYSFIHKRLTQVAELPSYRSSPRSI